MTFKRLFSHFKPYKVKLILIISITLISAIISIFTPKLLGDFITSIYESIKDSSSVQTKYLIIILITLSVLYLFNILLSFLENNLIGNLGQKIVHTLKDKTNQKLSKLPVSYYETHSKGELLSKFNNDIDSITTIYTVTLPKTINYIATFIGTLIMMFYIDHLLTLITLVSLPLIFLFTKLLLKLSKKKQEQYLQKIGYLNSVITESYLNMEIISLFNNDELMTDSFKKLNKELSKTNLKVTLITSLLSPFISLINYLTYLLILVLGSKHVIEGRIKFGEIQALIQYTKQLGSPINSFTSLTTQIQNSLLAAKRIFEILDEKEDEENTSSNTINPINKIEFKNVSFSYNDTPFIENLNLSINKGEKIAIVGETGSGKSTIINLLMNFYKINKGEILINGKNLYDYNLKSYYNQTSLVPQNTWLLNDTIENNLKYGNTDILEDSLAKTCKDTNFIEIINKMPNLYKEIINECTQNISEGEKQLLTITRALLKEHSLLVLDEATSYIDSKNEELIQNAINNNYENKITIIVAHRLSTIINADKILVIKNGKIIESGTHDSLYKEKGEYFKLLQAL